MPLDAGIVPSSTLGWLNPEWIPGATRRSPRRASRAPHLPEHAVREKWFRPTGSRRGGRISAAGSYSQCFMRIHTLARPSIRLPLPHLTRTSSTSTRPQFTVLGDLDRPRTTRSERMVKKKKRDTMPLAPTARRTRQELRFATESEDVSGASHLLELGQVLVDSLTSGPSSRPGPQARARRESSFRSDDRWLRRADERLRPSTQAASRLTTLVAANAAVRA